MRSLRATLVSVAALCASFPLSGCLVMGYSSQGGWWVWPGSIGITVLLIALMLLLNRR